MTTTTAHQTATRTYRTVNPATGEHVQTFDTATDAQAEDLLAAAHAAFPSWRATSLSHRIQLFHRMADLIEATRDELARLVTPEMGKPLYQSAGEVPAASAMFRYYAGSAEELLADEHTEMPGLGRAIIRREPLGVVLGIEPW